MSIRAMVKHLGELKFELFSNETKLSKFIGKFHKNGVKLKFDDGVAWMKEGKRHRLDGPAVIYNDGTREWYKDGKLHRDDGPAVTEPDINDDRSEIENKYWYKYGVLKKDSVYNYLYEDTTYYDDTGLKHRDDGPAYSRSCGCYTWYKHGMKHRESSPAQHICKNHSFAFTLYGMLPPTNQEDNRWYLNDVLDREDDLPSIVIRSSVHSREQWCNNKGSHREGDKPAQILHNITRDGKQSIEHLYYINGYLHRFNKPAIIKWYDGVISSEEYYLKGNLHNPVGPAECSYGPMCYPAFGFRDNGIPITLDTFIKRLEKRWENLDAQK